jgi:hypothetical protein
MMVQDKVMLLNLAVAVAVQLEILPIWLLLLGLVQQA